MVAIPEPIDPTLAAVDAAIEEEQDTRPRPYLGASSIGDPCSRKLWYSFRWAASKKFAASTLRLFEDGHRGEALMAERLRKVPGLMLSTEADDGRQWGISDHEGHFRGHCDGFIKGLLQAPKTPHVWEHKVCNETKQKKLAKLKQEKGEKEALAHWDPVYYAQAQIYMHYFELTRHYLTCSSPGERTTVSCRTDYCREHAEPLVQKAQDIITSDRPPTRLSDDSTHWLCKFCDYHSICHDITPEAISCRTCVHAYPDRDATWSCTKHGLLSREAQEAACPEYQAIGGDA
jgi:CRISPR/Cas system-associated exonuclease Cas4 (RecB family)